MSDVIFAYTRAQAIEDGVLVDVTATAREAGFRIPVAITRAVWESYVAVPEACPWQDVQGRLWDILACLKFAAKRSDRLNRVQFLVLVQNSPHAPCPAKLKAICHPGDNREPVLTVLLPNED